MSDFCKQCAEEIFGIGTPSDLICNLGPGTVGLATCEGCGPCLVTREGICVDMHCLDEHGKKGIGRQIRDHWMTIEKHKGKHDKIH
jgi:hypothetical protein